MADEILSAQQLRERLSYDPETGVLRRRRAIRGSAANSIVGCDSGRGYIKVAVHGRRYYAHRLIWLWMTGQWPDADVDHINGNPSDNRWVNLRAATRSQNLQNLIHKPAGASGVRGVTWDARNQRWRAQLRVNKTYVDVGRFESIEDAERAYLAAKRKNHEFSNV